MTGAKQAAIGRELMRKSMKFYLAPVAAVLFRALVEAGPTAGLFLVEPTGEVVADRLCRYARLTPGRRHLRQLPRADGVAGIYSVCLVGAIPGGSPIDADAAPVAADRNCQKNLEARPGAPRVSIGLSVF